MYINVAGCETLTTAGVRQVVLDPELVQLLREHKGAIRDSEDPFRQGLDEAFHSGGMLTVDLLYGDHEGGQRTISRFILTREEDGNWLPGVVRHWPLESSDPRGRESQGQEQIGL
jgi:hypothetical protein